MRLLAGSSCHSWTRIWRASLGAEVFWTCTESLVQNVAGPQKKERQTLLHVYTSVGEAHGEAKRACL